MCQRRRGSYVRALSEVGVAWSWRGGPGLVRSGGVPCEVWAVCSVGAMLTQRVVALRSASCSPIDRLWL